jgi:dTDP-4-amino-4,6-dideoxygalactose transaminase
VRVEIADELLASGPTNQVHASMRPVKAGSLRDRLNKILGHTADNTAATLNTPDVRPLGASPVQLVFTPGALADAVLYHNPEAQQATQLLDMVDQGEIEGWYALPSLPALCRLLEHNLRLKTTNSAEAGRLCRKILQEIITVLKPLPQNEEAVLHALFAAEETDEDLEHQLLVNLATSVLPTPLLVTKGQWPTMAPSLPAATSGEIIEIGIAAWMPAKQSIQFMDLAAQQRSIRPQLEQRIHNVLRHGRYILGPEVAELEQQLSTYTGARHTITCSSGTDALLMALMALNVRPGDAVFTTPFTFVATADVIARLGATPVFVDIDPLTCNLDPLQLEQAIGKTLSAPPQGRLRAKAIIAVDLYGLPCDYDAIEAIANKYGIPVIQDGAQSFGATYKTRRSGTLGTICCTSFFPSKPLGTYGDAGAAFTTDDALAEKMRSIRVHGQGKDKYDTVRLGIKGRMDSLQAAILLSKLPVYPQEMQVKNKIAQLYAAKLSQTAPELTLPAVPEDMQSAWALYTIQAKDSAHRATLQARLKMQQIPNVIYYAKPLHLQPVFASLGYKVGDFPVAEQCAGRVFSLPMHPYMTEAEVERVVVALSNNLR